MNIWSKIGLCQKLDHEVELDKFIGVNSNTMVVEENLTVITRAPGENDILE
jgi:hypothetical protein